MSLYLQIAVGAGLYLLDASQVFEIRPDIRGEDKAARWQGEAVPTVDLRKLFEEPADSQASCVLVAQAGETPAALIVDRVEGLAEFGAAEFRSLPPIGPIGRIFDAVTTRPADQRLLLRVRGERVLPTATAAG